MFVLMISAVLVLITIIVVCYSKLFGIEEQAAIEYRGAVLSHVHKFGSGYGSEHYKINYSHLKKVGYDTVQLNTFAFMNHREYTNLLSESDPTMTDKNIEAEIQNLKEYGFKVMLKPHVWIAWWNFDAESWKDLNHHRDPRNQIYFKDPIQRAEWFSSYTDFIISQAELAERTGVDILVIGTELVKMSKYTSRWVEIINRVRKVYRGKITYAAEGVNAFNIDFWDKLDYIGIDAYFNLCKKRDTTMKNLFRGWRKVEPGIRKLSRKYGKKVIFTEIGYKSVEGTASRPWEWDKVGKVSQEQQALAFEAFSIVFKNKPYLAGVFVWKYYADLDTYEEERIPQDFTPYGKKAEKVLSGWFGSQE